MIRLATLVLLLCAARPVFAEEVRCAVASNFADCLEEIAAVFEDSTDHTVVIISGSTGSHYAQIRQGAPFDVFFAADVERPGRLEDEGLIIPDSRTTYALGRLALWARIFPAGVKHEVAAILAHPDVETVAVADARLAPYGRAARQVLDTLESGKDNLVTGRNVGQVWHFVASGAADAGFVALSQTFNGHGGNISGIILDIPVELYDPIEQQVVLLPSDRTEAAAAFVAFVTGPTGRMFVGMKGYGVPEVSE